MFQPLFVLSMWASFTYTIDWNKPLPTAHVYNVHFELNCSRMGLVSTRGFYKLCLKTLGAVYFLIAVGGIVRPIGRKSSPVSARLQRVLFLI